MTRRLMLGVFMTLAVSAFSFADEPDAQAKAEARKVATNNLKIIGLACHMYADKHGHMPNNITDDKGNLLLSWRVELLPFLEQEALYKEFKRNEAWDSTTNKALVEKMPKLFDVPLAKTGKGETLFRGFTGPDTVFEAGKKVHFRDFGDGTSNTILVASAEKACPWTKPDDLVFDPKKDELPKMGGFETTFLALMGDGSVRMVKKTVAKETMKALITRNGGETLP